MINIWYMDIVCLVTVVAHTIAVEDVVDGMSRVWRSAPAKSQLRSHG